jgi:hypothetical protein
MEDEAAKKAAVAKQTARKTRLSKLSLNEAFSPSSGLSVDEYRDAVMFKTKPIIVDWLCTAETREVRDCETRGGKQCCRRCALSRTQTRLLWRVRRTSSRKRCKH